MKVAILAGGFGTRLAEETEKRPKPMVEIGGMPILWHIMMMYSAQGFEDFVIALGYKGAMIKRFMVEYCQYNADLRLDFRTGSVQANGRRSPEWSIELVDTGLPTMTGGRIKRLAPHLGEGTFMLTWGDGLSDIDIGRLLAFHREHGKLATVAVVRPPARFGHVDLDGDCIREFSEKPQAKSGWINGAFFVLEPAVLDYIEGDQTSFEREPLQALAREGQLMAYRHDSFWQCMDTLREKRFLSRLWDSGEAPWKNWE